MEFVRYSTGANAMHLQQGSGSPGKRFGAASVRAVTAALVLVGSCIGIAHAQLITEFGGLAPNANPRGIVKGPDGNLWFQERSVGLIGRITTAGVVTEFGAG